ncbi:hypothetical protein BH10BAC6_BH10BAC6_12030 [soil metagenome]
MEQLVTRLDKARPVSGILTTVFDVLRQIARPLLRTLLVTAGPYVALGALMVGLGFNNVFSSLQLISVDPSRTTSEVVARMLQDLVYWVIGMPILASATLVIYVVCQSYVITYQQLGRVPTVDEAREGRVGAWGTALRLFGLTCLGFMICVAVIVSPLLVSQYLLIVSIPFGMFALMWGIVPVWIAFAACRAEGLSVIPGIRYSWQLVKGHWWFCIGVIVMISIVQGLLGTITNIAELTLLEIFAATGLQPDAMTTVGMYVVGGMMGLKLFVSAFLAALLHVGAVVTYYCLVERKEARSLSRSIDMLGQS